MTKRDKISYLLLGLIFFLALFLRLYRLNFNAPSLYSDEVGGSIWYWSRVRDQSISHALQIVRGAMASPISVAWLLGFTPLITRLPAAINGSILVIATFLFATSISKNRGSYSKIVVGLLASLLTAILPWSFSISRLYGNVPLILILCSLHIALYLRSTNIQSKIISTIPIILSTYYYPSMVIIMPLVALMILRDIWAKLSQIKKRNLVPILVGLPFILAVLLQLRFHFFSTN